jgi:hypothetical protein
MKTLLISMTFALTLSNAIAGGGGLASSTCSYGHVKTLKTCDSKNFFMEINKVQFFKFAENGDVCPRGGEFMNVIDIDLKIDHLNLPGAMTKPSTVLVATAPISSAIRGGGLILNDLHEVDGKNSYVISATVSVSWPEYQKINGVTFEDTLKCD